MGGARGLAVVAVFTALVVSTDFAMAPLWNVKLMDTVVFVVAFAFGFREGAAVAVLSESVWSFVSPVGAAGLMTPFLVGGEVLFAAAGWGASRVWALDGKRDRAAPVYIGAAMAVCAFLWDLETNAATALIWGGAGLSAATLAATEAAGFLFPFPLAHELADLAMGILIAPAAIVVIPRAMRRG